MPRLKSAIKRVKTSERNRLYNLSFKTAIKTLMKKVTEHLAKKEYEAALTAKNSAFSLIDKATCKGILHKNNGAHKKARISTWLKNIEPPQKTSKAKSKS